jgi:hypothetical protein
MERLLSRVVMAATGFITAFILVSVAIAFLGGALYFWLVSLALAPPWAALLVAAAGLGLAALIIFAARMISVRRRTTRLAEARPSVSDAASDLGALIAQKAVSLAQAHPYRAFVVALIAGFTTGASSELREILKDSLKS